MSWPSWSIPFGRYRLRGGPWRWTTLSIPTAGLIKCANFECIWGNLQIAGQRRFGLCASRTHAIRHARQTQGITQIKRKESRKSNAKNRLRSGTSPIDDVGDVALINWRFHKPQRRLVLRQL